MISRSIFLAALLSATCALHGDVFQIGGTDITVSAPADYVRVTPQMPQVEALFAAMEDPLNDTLATYIGTEAAQVALAGELPVLERYFMVKVSHRAVAAVISVADFKKIRSAVVAQQEESMEDLRKRLPELVARMEQNIADELGIEASLRIMQVVPLGVSLDEQDAMAYSMAIGFGGDAEGDGMEVVIATSTIVNVSGKVISLYTYGAAGDLVWTQEHSAAWAAQILAANPPAPASGYGSLDRKRLVVGTAVGVLIGGLVAIVAVLQRKRRNHGK